MWGLVATVGLKLLEWFLDARKADEAARKAYLAFVEAMGNSGLISARLKSKYEQARKQNEDKISPPQP